MALALLDVSKATAVAYQSDPNSEEALLLSEIRNRKLSIESEQNWFRTLCDRWDNLYWPQGFTAGGASHWASHESAVRPGMSHVSVNSYPSYVEIPAALQSIEPLENMVANDVTEQARLIAAMAERLYFAWKRDQDFELKAHKACVVKSLYGRTAAKVYWDADGKKPEVEIVDQPRNLYLGWKDSEYDDLEWALYCYAVTPATAMEDWGVRVDSYVERGENGAPDRVVPYVVAPTVGLFSDSPSWRSSQLNSDLQVEVYDYWYRAPARGAKIKFGKPTKFETWNAIFVGNAMVENARHPEYDGRMPYVPLFNNYLPGVPDGRPELYDIEQLVREKDEKFSENSQMISRAIKGQYWQLTGPEAPSTVPSGVKPTPNNVIAPGAGNRIEAIQPWMPEFQIDQYLARLDKELVDVSGLNDLLRGLASTQAMSSSKAVAVLVANYEMRIRMKRALYYVWRRHVWELAATIWSSKRSDLKPILQGAATLDLTPPSLTPRDDAEQATIALNLKEGKLWSAKRSMDHVGVDDPETEQDVIRSEQTDATLNPAAVQAMVSLMATVQQLNMQMQQLKMQQAAQATQGGPGAATLLAGGVPAGLGAPTTQDQALATARALGGGQQALPSQNGPGEQPVLPNEQMPANTPQGAAVAPPVGPEASQLVNQFMLQNGQVKSRLLGQQTIQKTQQPGGGG